MFILVKKRTLIIIFCILIIFVSSVTYFCVKQTAVSALKYCVVIDAGHGGVDVKLGQNEIFGI